MPYTGFFIRYRGHCISFDGEDLDESALGADVTASIAKEECFEKCTAQLQCTAVEWYEEPWDGTQCFLVTDARPADRGARGRRINGASCHVKMDGVSEIDSGIVFRLRRGI